MLGLSGGIGPLRASVSTRGVGGSVGPVNFGTGWGGGGALGAICFMFVMMFWVAVVGAAVAAVVVPLAWPLLLSIGLIGGAIGIVVGVVLEVAYLFVLLALWVRYDEAHEQQRQADERAAVLERGRELLDQAPALRAPMADRLAYLQDHPAGLSADLVGNLPNDFPRDEKFLGLGSAWLSAGRVAHRGGPRVQTDIEHGTWTVSDQCIRFRGATRTDKWPLSAITGVYQEPGRVLFSLSTRSSITGLSSADPEDDLVELRIAVEWARALPGPPTAAINLVESELAEFDASMQGLRDELAMGAKEPLPTLLLPSS